MLVPPPATAGGAFEVTITAGPTGGTTATTATFSFSATEQARFQCSLDGAAFAACESPKTYESLAQGSHTFTVEARSVISGGVDTATRTWTIVPQAVPINDPPVAHIKTCLPVTWPPCSGVIAREGIEEELDASGSHDPDGSIVKYEWDLDNDGGFETSTSSPTLNHVFEKPGGSTLRLRVTDDVGATATTSVPLTVLAAQCLPAVTYKRLRATAQCFKRRKSGLTTRFRSNGPVSVNGIQVDASRVDVAFLGGTEDPILVSVSSPSAKVYVDGPQGTHVRVRTGKVFWAVKDNELKGFKVGSDAKVNGLPITGMPSLPALDADKKSSTVKLHVRLPSQFGGASSSKPLVFTPGKASSAQAGALSFEVPNAALGPIPLAALKVSYDGQGLWEIAASVGLPDPIPYEISGGLGIRNGAFEYGEAAIDKLNIPIGPVFLQRIHFRIEVKPKKSKCVPHVGKLTIWQVFEEAGFTPFLEALGFGPNTPPYNEVVDYGYPTFALCGGVGLTAGPEVLGAAALRLNADMGFALYDDRPDVLRAFGQLYVVEIPLASAAFALYSNGYFWTAGSFSFSLGDLASLKGGLSLEMYGAKFNAQGRIKACLDFVDWCAGATLLVSSKGLAACLSIDLFVTTWHPGFGVKWGQFPTLYFAGCSVGPYKETINAGPGTARRHAVAAGEERTIEIKPGLPGAVIAARGASAPPKFTLVGPKGETITTPDDLMPVERKPFFVLKDPRANLTQVAIGTPSPGRWRVIVEDGSSPLVSLASANGLNPPSIRAKVSGRGQHRVLSFDVRSPKRATVRFIERGASAGRLIAETKKDRGRIGFQPAPGRAERRKIVALVTQNGEPREEVVVARYRAPAAARPGAPRGLRIRRRGSRLLISWERSHAAQSYRSLVSLSDGRRLLFNSRRQRLRVPRVGSRLRGSVSVRAISPAGLEGPARRRAISPASRRG